MTDYMKEYKLFNKVGDMDAVAEQHVIAFGRNQFYKLSPFDILSWICLLLGTCAH